MGNKAEDGAFADFVARLSSARFDAVGQGNGSHGSALSVVYDARYQGSAAGVPVDPLRGEKILASLEETGLLARGTLAESEFESKGIVSEAGLARLRAFLNEVPAERIKVPLKSADVPRLFTPETFCKVAPAIA